MVVSVKKQQHRKGSRRLKLARASSSIPSKPLSNAFNATRRSSFTIHRWSYIHSIPEHCSDSKQFQHNTTLQAQKTVAVRSRTRAESTSSPERGRRKGRHGNGYISRQESPWKMHMAYLARLGQCLTDKLPRPSSFRLQWLQ